jgi:hypothetical protein
VTAAAVGGALVGLVLGLALAGGDDEADPESAIRDTRSQVTQAAGLLDVTPVEYSEAVSDGRVRRPAEYRGARAALERSRALYLEARPVVVLIDPPAARDIDASYARLARTMARFASADTVADQTSRLEGLLRDSVGLAQGEG